MVLRKLDSHKQKKKKKRKEERKEEIKKEISSFHKSVHKISSKWTKNLHAKPDALKLLKENIARALFHINHSNISFGSVLNIHFDP